MPARHLNSLLLDRLLRGVATPAEMREVAFHLLEGCPDCAQAAVADWLLDPDDGETSPAWEEMGATVLSTAAGPDAMFDRVRANLDPVIAAVREARAQAPALLAELLRHPLQRQRLLVRNNPRFQTLPLAEHILETAWEQGREMPREAETLARLGVEVVDFVDPALLGAELLNDIRGRGWAYLANFLRIQSFLREAESAFQRAEGFLAEGTGDPLEAARLLDLKATLRRSQMRHDEAGEMIDEALKIYLALGESHLAGRTMLSQALLLSEEGNSARAIEVLREAQDRLEPERDPYLIRVVQQNLASYLMNLGRYEEAMALIPSLRSRLVETRGQRLELLRLRWLEGKVLLGLGHESRAEAAFLEVRKGFVEQEIAYDAAVVSLELAGLYLRQGRTAEIRELTSQLVPIFQSRDLPQRVIAALLLFQQAVEKDALTLRLVEEVAEVIRNADERSHRRHGAS